MTWNYELFIDGAWTSEGASGSIEVVDPATEEVIGSVPEASTKTALRAVEAARRAFDEGPWPYMKPAERAARLVAMAEILEARAGDLRELIIAETGSTGFLTDAVQGAGSIGMLRSNAALVEHSFPWVENAMPTGGPTGLGGSAIGILFGAQAAGAAVGPICAGVLADHFGIMAAFYFLAGTIIVANLMIFVTPSGIAKNP